MINIHSPYVQKWFKKHPRTERFCNWFTVNNHTAKLATAALILLIAGVIIGGVVSSAVEARHPYYGGQTVNPTNRLFQNAGKVQVNNINAISDDGVIQETGQYDSAIQFSKITIKNGAISMTCRRGPIYMTSTYKGMTLSALAYLTNWFYENVAWGPEILTLQSFVIQDSGSFNNTYTNSPIYIRGKWEHNYNYIFIYPNLMWPGVNFAGVNMGAAGTKPKPISVKDETDEKGEHIPSGYLKTMAYYLKQEYYHYQMTLTGMNESQSQLISGIGDKKAYGAVTDIGQKMSPATFNYTINYNVWNHYQANRFSNDMVIDPPNPDNPSTGYREVRVGTNAKTGAPSSHVYDTDPDILFGTGGHNNHLLTIESTDKNALNYQNFISRANSTNYSAYHYSFNLQDPTPGGHNNQLNANAGQTSDPTYYYEGLDKGIILSADTLAQTKSVISLYIAKKLYEDFDKFTHKVESSCADKKDFISKYTNDLQQAKNLTNFYNYSPAWTLWFAKNVWLKYTASTIKDLTVDSGDISNNLVRVNRSGSDNDLWYSDTNISASKSNLPFGELPVNYDSKKPWINSPEFSFPDYNINNVSKDGGLAANSNFSPPVNSDVDNYSNYLYAMTRDLQIMTTPEDYYNYDGHVAFQNKEAEYSPITENNPKLTTGNDTVGAYNYYRDTALLNAFNANPYSNNLTNTDYNAQGLTDNLYKYMYRMPAKTLNDSGTVSYIFKNSTTQRSMMWGYVPTDKEYRFLDFTSGDQTYRIPIHTYSKTNNPNFKGDNFFYYQSSDKDGSKANNKTYLDDGLNQLNANLPVKKQRHDVKPPTNGYQLWLSDFNLLSNYVNAVMPKGNYTNIKFEAADGTTIKANLSSTYDENDLTTAMRANVPDAAKVNSISNSGLATWFAGTWFIQAPDGPLAFYIPDRTWK